MKQSWKIEIFKKNNLGRLKKKGRMGDANLTKLYEIKKYHIKSSHKFYSLNYKIHFLRKKIPAGSESCLPGGTTVWIIRFCVLVV